MNKDSSGPHLLIQLLCSNITGLQNNYLIPHLKKALVTLGSNISANTSHNEYELVEKIKRKLLRNSNEADAEKFYRLYLKLQSCNFLKNNWATLYFLHRLSDSCQSKSISHDIENIFSSTHMNLSKGDSRTNPRKVKSYEMTQSTITKGYAADCSGTFGKDLKGSLSATSGFASLQSSSSEGFIVNPAFCSNVTKRSASCLRGQIDLEDFNSARTLVSFPDNSILKNMDPIEINELHLVKDLMFVLHGIDGSQIKFDYNKERFLLSSNVVISRPRRQLVYRLSESGFLHNKIKQYIDSRSLESTLGLIGKNFCIALSKELKDYYRLIALIDSKVHLDMEDEGVAVGGGSISLRRLLVQMAKPLQKLTMLVSIVDACQGKKGGNLISNIYSFLQHGDPDVYMQIFQILTTVIHPICNFIARWMYEGRLEDSCQEFFVAMDTNVRDERLWHDKYSLRKSMVPQFITIGQANKILTIGKTVNFLKNVCGDRTLVGKYTKEIKAESLLKQERDSSFDELIGSVYKETSSYLLEVLQAKYKFYEHLKAIRRYLLLGQGDFIQHLMDLMEEDLTKPAHTLYRHNLTGILDTAIRATNAQFDHPEILKRIDVCLLEISSGETGWDVFTLKYHIPEHLQSIFTVECIKIYMRVFSFLWRAKRMEYILAQIWRDQTASFKTFKNIPEIGTMLHQCHVIGSEMLHFVQQVQYYINFEVLECCWAELLKKVKSAGNLDVIIAANQQFLDEILGRCLLGPQSNILQTQLRTIFDIVLSFQELQKEIHEVINEERTQRLKYLGKHKECLAKGDNVARNQLELTNEERELKFKKSTVPYMRSKLRNLSITYQKIIDEFLLMVGSTDDASLHCLVFRLNFNEFYTHHYKKIQAC